MYINESNINKMLLKSKILLVWGWISSLFWSATMLYAAFSKTGEYRRKDDVIVYILVVLFFAVLSLLGYLKIIISLWNQNMAKNARFLNSYFENDLDGRIAIEDIATVLGEKKGRIKRKLNLLKHKCMTGFELRQNENGTYVELESKKVKCVCKSCGGTIEKKTYFAGICPYCESLDIFAQVITNNKIYSIQYIKDEAAHMKASNEGERGSVKRESYFYITGDTDDSNKQKEFIYMFINGFFMFMIIICMMLALRDVIQGTENVFLLVAFIVLFMPFLYNGIKHYRNIIFISSAKGFSKVAAKSEQPMLSLENLFVENLKNLIDPYDTKQKRFSLNQKVNAFREIQKRGYIRNCSLIHFENEFKIGLSREIKKSVCPMCGAPLTGTLNDYTTCQHCGYEIEDAYSITKED